MDEMVVLVDPPGPLTSFFTALPAMDSTTLIQDSEFGWQRVRYKT